MVYQYINGDFFSSNESKIHISDLGIQRGFSIFDYFLVERGVPLFLDDYLERIKISSSAVIKDGLDLNVLKDLIIRVVQKNSMVNGAIKIIYSGGYSHNLYEPNEPNLMILALNYPTYPEHYYSKGTSLITFSHQRNSPEVKTTNYFFPLSVLEQVKKAKALDVLYYQNNMVTESSRSNFFIVTHENEVLTASEGILPGITRKQILKFDLGLKIVECDIKIDDVFLAKEAFMTSSTKPVFPVVSIDGKHIGNGKVGEITKRILAEFKEHKQRYIQSVKTKF